VIWIPCKWNPKESKSSHMSHTIDFKSKAVKKDKEGHYIMIKGSIQQEEIATVIYMHPILEYPNNKAKCH
jgi:hypothetical protein